MGATKDMRQLVVQLEKAGYDVRLTKKKHYAVKKGDGPTVFMPCTPSDTRGMHRVHAKLRKIGFDKRELQNG